MTQTIWINDSILNFCKSPKVPTQDMHGLGTLAKKKLVGTTTTRHLH